MVCGLVFKVASEHQELGEYGSAPILSLGPSVHRRSDLGTRALGCRAFVTLEVLGFRGLGFRGLGV